MHIRASLIADVIERTWTTFLNQIDTDRKEAHGSRNSLTRALSKDHCKILHLF